MSKKRIFVQSGMFIIRPVDEAEFEAILEVYHQSEDFLALGPLPEASAAMVQADLEQSRMVGGLFCGIFQPDGRLIGVVDFIPQGYLSQPEDAYIELLMLAQPYRSLGLGSEIVHLIEAEITKEHKVQRIKAHVQENNPKALAFWQRLGYRVTGPSQPRPDGTIVFPLCKSVAEIRGQSN